MRRISTYKQFENYQQAIKNKDILNISTEEIEEIKYLVSNKNYIYDICKVLSYNNKYSFGRVKVEDIIDLYEEYLKTKTYLPLNIEKTTIKEFKEREKLLNSITEDLPKLFRINNKDIRLPYNTIEHDLNYMMELYSLTRNKKKETLDKINSVICSSNKTISELIDFLEDKDKLDSVDSMWTSEELNDIENISDGLIYSSDIVYKSEDDTKYIIKIDSPEAMQFIGRNTFWCHTYKGSSNAFSQYTYYGYTFVFIDLKYNDNENMCVLTHKFFEFYYNDELQEAIDLYNTNYDEYMDYIEENQEIEEIVFNRHNEPLMEPIRYLQTFLGDDFSKYDLILDL